MLQEKKRCRTQSLEKQILENRKGGKNKRGYMLAGTKREREKERESLTHIQKQGEPLNEKSCEISNNRNNSF